MNKTKFCLAFIFLINAALVQAHHGIEAILKKKIPAITSITKLESSDHFKEVFEIMIEQPLDHNNPAAGTYQQRVFLSHTAKKSPMLIVTEGYGARQRTYELSKILNSNQMIVEYRYFGKSKPATSDWTYLKNDQALEDLHRLRKLFRKLYRKEWISTGISKGGTTCLMYKHKYPKDVKVAVPYVAPLATAQADKRTDEHILTIGTKECRDKLTQFQRLALQKREELIPMIDEWAIEKKAEFTFLTTDKVLEYAVLEYTFSFWQWGADCATIPDETASTEEVFKHLKGIVGYDFYSDASCKYFLPAFYQFITESGYYGFLNEHLQDLLVSVKKPTNVIFAPQDTDLSFTPYCQNVIDFLDVKGNNIIYIYGEVDPWTACGYQPTKNTNALRMDKKGGSHTTRIASFSKAEQQKIYKRLDKWLKTDILPLK